MKKYRKTLTVVIILVVALMMFAAFFGVNKTNENGEKVALLPNLNLGMEFGDSRVITAAVNQEITTTIYDKDGQLVEPEEGVEYKEEDGYTTVETPVNDSSLKKLSNYEKAREIIKERLEKSGVSEFFIDMHEVTGKMKIQIPENENADDVEALIKNSGGFLLLDGETFEVVFDSSYLKKADVMNSQGDLETAVFLQIEFNEEGTAKLQELNNKYIETTTTKTNEEGVEEEVTESKKAWVILNDAILGSTVLPNIVYDNKVMLTMGASSDSKEIQEAVDTANKQAILLNSGTTPLVYDYTSETQKSSINMNQLFVALTIIGAVFVVVYVYLVIKFKARGFISVYFQIGFLGILLLILRLTGALLTMEGIAGIIISMVLEYLFTYIVLANIDREAQGMYSKSNLTFFLNTFPIYIVAVVFAFATRAHISSFGTTLFWGILMIYIYNFIFSKFVFENLSGRSE